MPRQKPSFALSVLSLFFLSLGFLFLGQQSAVSVVGESATPAQFNQDPFATIKTIVRQGAEVERATSTEVTIVHDGSTGGAEAGMLLYKGDHITTGRGVKVTILFLDQTAEKDNEVVVDELTHIELGSVFNWAGRILARVKDRFQVKTRRAQWGVVGTEFELAVDEETNENRLTVLKGAVQIDTIARHSGGAPRRADQNASMFMNASFREPEPPQQSRMEFVAVSGRVLNEEREFILANNCRQRHVYRVASPVNLSWFQFMGADQFAIDGNSTRNIRFAIKLDATRVPVGTQESQITFPCVDCSSEPGCHLRGLLLAITMNVIGEPRPTPTVQPTPPETEERTTTGPESAVAVRMQEIILPSSGGLRKSDASIQRVDQTLNWSNPVIVKGEPTYSAESVVPNFRTWAERDRVFREVRRSSIINDDPRSKEILADIYIDWGNGAKAQEELKGLSQSTQQTPQRLTTLGEAHRLMGDLRRAEQLLKQAVGLDPNWSPALNALGNVYLDQAKVEQDKKNYPAARAFLERARAEYAKALQAQPMSAPNDNHARPRQQPAPAPRKVATVAQSNLGEVQLRLGEMAKDEGNSEEALRQFEGAEQAFGNAARIDRSYQFAFTGLGDVYRETGETLAHRGDKAAADQNFAKSKDQYNQALTLHNQMAEAYVGLGRVFDDTGQPREALRFYRKATQVRPELPEPHYYYAVALVPVDPRQAAEQAGAYLKTERRPLKQGEKAQDAVSISTDGTRGINTQTATPTPTPTPTPDPIATGTPVKVPGLKGDQPDAAVRELQRLGLRVERKDQFDCEASQRVLYSEPAKDQRVRPGSLITIFVSSLDPNAVTVPRVSGLSRSEAEDRLGGVGLRANIRGTRETDDRARDTVLDQSPGQGKPLMRGCEVALTLAVPIPRVQVPNLIGLTRDEATRRLPRFGGEFTRGQVIEVDNYRSPAGTVVDQDPKPETLVRRGTAITLYVARFQQRGTPPPPPPPPPQDVVVPNLFGKTEAQAKLIISQTRGALRMGQVSYQTNYQFTSNVVMSQEPVAGRTVRFGTSINITIAVQPVIQ